ncbi:MAG: hypothetical protein JWM82_3004 [Myxococcales bacterium]|nr:hypothetical protein [Myxococcales bacterium]
MRPICALSAGATLLLVASGMGWAGNAKNDGKHDASKNKEVSAAFNKQFQWEEGVVGPRNKGVDHEKIAAMQEEGRREAAAKHREKMDGRAPKVARTEGVNGPASASLPTMDIEKAAPASSIHGAHGSVKKASYSPPRQHDEIDAVLAENRGTNDSSGQAGLDSVLSPKTSRKASKPTRGRRRR